MKPIRLYDRGHNTKTVRHLYNYYLENTPPGGVILGYYKWKKVFNELMFALSRAMITDLLVVPLGTHMGHIGIVKNEKFDKRMVNHQESKKMDYHVYHHNMHSDGYFFRFRWKKGLRNTRKYAAVKNLKIYTFDPVRDEKRKMIGARGLAAWIKNNSVDPYKKDYDAPFWL